MKGFDKSYINSLQGGQDAGQEGSGRRVQRGRRLLRMRNMCERACILVMWKLGIWKVVLIERESYKIYRIKGKAKYLLTLFLGCKEKRKGVGYIEGR